MNESHTQVEPASESRRSRINQLDSYISALRRGLGALKALDPFVVPPDDNRVRRAQDHVNEVVQEIFGKESEEFRHYLIFNRFYSDIGTTWMRQSHFVDGLHSATLALEAWLTQFEQERATILAWNRGSHPQTDDRQSAAGQKVFIVHGHDEATKQKVCRFILGLNLEPVVLHEQPNQGRTVIEKFEHFSDVGFAVVLFTGDDIGAAAMAPSEWKPRARQNVLFELGYFTAKLGRRRVCVLCEMGLEILSDYLGVVYVQLDSEGAWRLLLARELKHAGMDVDLNLAI